MTAYRAALIASALSFLGATAGAQVPRQTSRPTRVVSAGDVFKIGVSFDVAWFQDFSKSVADQPNLTTSKADDVAFGAGGSLELSPVGIRPLFTRVGVNFGIQNFEQAYNSSSPLDPTNATGKVKGLFVEGQLGLHVLRSRTSSFDLMTGATWARDDADLDFTYASGPVSTSRVENNWKWNAGAKLWKALDERTGIQLGVTYTTSFKPVDADQNWRVSTGLTLGFGSPGY